MDPARLLRRINQGAVQNVAFSDMVALVGVFGFTLARINGSHHIFKHAQIPEQINLQEVDGEAKPYQIRRFLRLVERHSLSPRSES